MPDQSLLVNAKMNKKNEFYTQYEDIQREMNAYIEYNPDVFRDKTVLLPCDDPEWSNFTRFFAQNFERFGLKKLISTSYAIDSKNNNQKIYKFKLEDYLTEYEKNDPKFNEIISPKKGKIFTLTRKNRKVDINDLKWDYLEGDGDFRSEEVKKLRDEADIIITNPPFALFREFFNWIVEADKNFIIIGNQNAITYKEIFPFIKENKIWLGKGFKGNVGFFDSPYQDLAKSSNHKEGKIRISGVMWFTNLDHGRRHQPLSLMKMEDNLKFSKHKEIKEEGYPKYDNYDAIEVKYTDAIPSDYDGVMGVPITFLDKYNPEQFEILGSDCYEKTPPTKTYSKKVKVKDGKRMKSLTGTMGCVIRTETFGSGTYFDVGYPVKAVYKRIFIRKK